MEKIGFFGGSFNPPTNAHLEIAKTALEEMELDKVYFVPMGNTYKKPGLIDEKLRYEMLQIACAKYEKIDVENIELNLTKSLTTIEAFKRIESKYSKTQNYYIMGADNFLKLPNWQDAEELITNYKLIVFARKGEELSDLINNNKLINSHLTSINLLKIENNISCSSGIIRDLIKEGKNEIAKKYTEERIVEFINKNKLYN